MPLLIFFFILFFFVFLLGFWFHNMRNSNLGLGLRFVSFLKFFEIFNKRFCIGISLESLVLQVRVVSQEILVLIYLSIAVLYGIFQSLLQYAFCRKIFIDMRLVVIRIDFVLKIFFFFFIVVVVRIQPVSNIPIWNRKSWVKIWEIMDLGLIIFFVCPVMLSHRFGFHNFF